MEDYSSCNDGVVISVEFKPTGLHSVPTYSDMMKEIFGPDWCLSEKVVSGDADKKCRKVYNFILQHLEKRPQKKPTECCDNPNIGPFGMRAVKCYNCGWIKGDNN